MPDTKIKQINPHEWVDVDNPSVVHKVRRLARQARRASKVSNSSQSTIVGVGTSSSSNFTMLSIAPLPSLTPTGFSTPVQIQTPTFTSLQEKLYKRLTQKQGVDSQDAIDVISSNGYNKAASYGHMRAAGANHAEALIVINLNSPVISLAYGIARAKKLNHTDALTEALHTDDDD